MEFLNRVAVLTAGGSGIGRAVAAAMGRRDITAVALVAVNDAVVDVAEPLNVEAGRSFAIPYKGDTPAIADLMGGQVDVAFIGISSVLPQVVAGKVRALAVSTDKRTSAAPQVPTVIEAGVKGYEFSTWWGVVAPTGTSREVVDKLANALAKVTALPELKERFTSLGIDVAYANPTEFAALIKASVEQYGTIAKGAGVKPE